MRIVQQVVRSSKITWKKIQWDMDPISEHFLETGAFRYLSDIISLFFYMGLTDVA